uniref:Uncharacterized protein n=1 Tax=Populus trichocarpa TaxID=3694 RepID=A0A3N7FFV6_POPTR
MKARWLVIPFLFCCFFFLCFWFCLPDFCTLSPVRFPLCFFFFEIVFGKKAFGVCFRIPPALDEDYDGKGPGAAGWLDPSFLWFSFLHARLPLPGFL